MRIRFSLVLFVAMSLAVPGPARAGATVERGYVTSFDDVPIVYNLFIPDTGGPFPVIFSGHGWSETGQTEIAGFLKRMLDNGY